MNNCISTGLSALYFSFPKDEVLWGLGAREGFYKTAAHQWGFAGRWGNPDHDMWVTVDGLAILGCHWATSTACPYWEGTPDMSECWTDPRAHEGDNWAGVDFAWLAGHGF